MAARLEKHNSLSPVSRVQRTRTIHQSLFFREFRAFRGSLIKTIEVITDTKEWDSKEPAQFSLTVSRCLRQPRITSRSPLEYSTFNVGAALCGRPPGEAQFALSRQPGPANTHNSPVPLFVSSVLFVVAKPQVIFAAQLNKSCFTCASSTPVSRASRPRYLNVSRRWSIPMQCRIVAFMSRICTGFSTTL